MERLLVFDLIPIICLSSNPEWMCESYEAIVKNNNHFISHTSTRISFYYLVKEKEWVDSTREYQLFLPDTQH